MLASEDVKTPHCISWTFPGFCRHLGFSCPVSIHASPLPPPPAPNSTAFILGPMLTEGQPGLGGGQQNCSRKVQGRVKSKIPPEH